MANDDFQNLAQQKRSGIASEIVGFLKEHRKWWLTPIVISVLVLGALVILGGTAAGPFIYTLF